MVNGRQLFLALGIFAVLTLSSLTIAYSMGMFSKSGPRTNGHAANLDDEDEVDDVPRLVRVIHPRLDPSFTISVQQLCSVEAFTEAELHPRVAGTVSRVAQKGLHDRVFRDEVLVEIDVPELPQEVQQKEAMIFQRTQELRLAKAHIKTALAMVEVANSAIDQKASELVQALETSKVRESRWKRMVGLKKETVVDEGVVDEFKRDYGAAEAGVDAARAAIRKAKADLLEKESMLELAQVDVQLKEAAVKTAERIRDHSLAMLSYTRLRANFDGIITQRKVDPGYFVQNGSTGWTEPLMTIARTDLVTVVMKVPDNAAPFVKKDTGAIIQINELPGVFVRGRVTRFSPAIQNKDRTMRVEVDFFNGTEKEYHAYKSRVVAGTLSAFGHTDLCGSTAMLAASTNVWLQNVKGQDDPFPLLPEGLTKLSENHRFLPGMSGYMRLSLDHFQDAYLIPSSAVYSLGGKNYILEIRDNVSHKVPVRVQMNDGRLAKVVMVMSEANPVHGEPEVLKELSGDELIVLSRQIEIGDGKQVQASEPEPW